ncbi:MAG: BlaI/MecI/CopY family transcriptional regulator [Clostridiaceae bacterium]|nr:BlaI/MecI/CopY family transcriptional regulator [Clostridiaceae bacterium]
MQKDIKRLGDAELEIMQVIWHTGAPMTAGSIQEKLRGRRDWQLSSLMTALSRLAEKGFVQCDRSTRTNLYTALISEAAYREEAGQSFLAKLYDNSIQNFVTALYDAHALTPDDLGELRSLIDEMERRQKRD